MIAKKVYCFPGSEYRYIQNGHRSCFVKLLANRDNLLSPFKF